jgi:hypothetical protein
MTSTNTQVKVDNGVNVAALIGAREALSGAPEAAQFKWRTSSKWVNGTHTKTTISGFFGLGEEQSRGKVFTIESDTRKSLLRKTMRPHRWKSCWPVWRAV